MWEIFLILTNKGLIANIFLYQIGPFKSIRSRSEKCSKT